jgi:hypothetical protein
MVRRRTHRGSFAGHRLALAWKRRAGILQHGSTCVLFGGNCIQHERGTFVPALAPGRRGAPGSECEGRSGVSVPHAVRSSSLRQQW